MGIMSDSDVPGLQDLPLVKRPRGAAVCASSRGPRFVRRHRARRGQRLRLVCARRSAAPRGAIAANVLKALDAVAEAEAEFGNSPRSIALAFDRFLAGKEAPGRAQRGG